MAFPKGPGAEPPASQTSGHDNMAEFRSDMDVLNDESGLDTQDEASDEIADDEEELAAPSDEIEDEESEDEETEDEDGDEPPADKKDEEDEEDDTPLSLHPRPTFKQIKDKYPDFFKQFPDMRHVLFREGEYAKIFPTVDDAKEGVEKAENFEHFSTLLKSGNAQDFQEFLNGIKEGGDDNLQTMADHFLPSLYKTDRELYFKTTTPIAASLLRNAYKAAEQTNDANLKNAALHIARWALGDMGYATGEKKLEEAAKPEASKDPKYEQEKADFYKQKYTEVRTFVSDTSRKKLEKEITRGLDPGGVFNEFTTKLLVDKVMEELDGTLEKDKRHMDNINSMWRHAHKAGFAGDWKDRILTTYLSRARALMPAIRQKIRTEALSDKRQRDTVKGDKVRKSGDRKEVQGSGTTSRGPQRGTAVPSKSIDWSKTSDMDFLSDKVTLKK